MNLYPKKPKVFNRTIGCIYLLLLAFSATAAGKGEVVEPAAPIVYYHFKVMGEFSGGEDIWVNNVYLGKMPFTITREEFLEKVPFLERPPEGYADEQKQQMKGNWFRIQIIDLKKRDNKYSVGYSTEQKNYYARVKLNDEWGKGHDGGGGGGGGSFRQDYNVSIRVGFPSREKLISEKEKRFKDLLRIARLNNYQVSDKWFQALDTYGDKGWRDLRYMPEAEPGIQKLIDGWALWKFNINNPQELDSAKRGFEEICSFVNVRKNYRFDAVEGKAVELIYEKLDLDELIEKFLRELKSNRRLTKGYRSTDNKGGLCTVLGTNHEGDDVVPASTSAVYHALLLWDQKLDAQDYNSDNPVELRLVPAMLLKSKGHQGDFTFKQALRIGGSVMAKYLLRQNWRTCDRSDRKNVSVNFDYHNEVNHWFVCLMNMDDPAGRKFRQQNASRVMQLADKMWSAMSMHESPPAFLFLDNELGKESIAWQYWDKYSANVDLTSPPWAHYKIKQKYLYLSMIPEIATLNVYLDVWHETHKSFDRGSELYMSADSAFQVLPKNIQEPFGKTLLADCEEKMKSLEVSSRKYQDLYDLKGTIHRQLMNYGHKESIDYYIRNRGLDKRLNWENAVSSMKSYRVYRPRYIEYLSRHESPNVRKLAVIGIEAFPTPENQKILEHLLNDQNPEVKQAAEGASAELMQLRGRSLSELVAYPAEKEQD